MKVKAVAILVILAGAWPGTALARLAVTASSPASGLVVAGGAPITLTLQGTDLDEVQSAAVLLGDRPSPDVTAQLGPAAKAATSRTVTIAARGLAKPAKDYKLELTAGKVTIVAPIALEISTAPPPMPLRKLEPKPALPALPKVEAPKAPVVDAPKPPVLPKPALAEKPKVELPKLEPSKVELPKTPAVGAPKLPAVSAPAQLRPAPAPVAMLPPEPSVASVAPQALRIQAGSGPVTLRLSGAALERLQSAIVVQSARPVPGIVAQLGPPSYTSRNVTITVQPSAPPGRDYRVQLSGGRQPIVVTAPIEVYWPISVGPPVASPAVPVLTRVERTADGYALVGRGFGVDRARVQVFEGNVNVGTLVSVAPERIVVRSRPSGLVQHRVVVAGLPSATVTFNHPSAQRVVGSVGVSAGELDVILRAAQAKGLSPGPAVGAPGVPSRPTPSAAPARPPRVPQPGTSGFQPKGVTTGELSMSGIGD